jgi:16S rRNA (cytidine1402-2'-O)-methyltransferase
MIFYEAPHKLPATLKDMLEAFGNRKITLIRELTKSHEEVIRTTLKQAAELYNDENKPRGEFVLIVEGYDPQIDKQEYTLEQAVNLAKEYMAAGDSASMAAKAASGDTGIKKGDIYKELIAQKG